MTPPKPPREAGAARVAPVDPSLLHRAMEQLGAIVQGVRRTFGDQNKGIIDSGDVASRTDPKPPEFHGPRQPQRPLAPTGAAVGRQFDYPTGANLQSRPRAYDPVSFEQLRQLADNYDLLRLCIETRKDQLSKVPWRILPKKRTGQTSRAVADERCETLEKFFLMPDKEHDWFTWLRMLMEDMFVIDAATIYARRTMAGDIWALEVIDGATIKRVISEDGRTPLPPHSAYQQILKGMPAVDYTTEELCYRPRNVRSNKFYGYSVVEQIIMTVNIAIRRQVSQLQSYTEGNIPEALAGTPEGWSPQQIGEFQSYWDSIMEGNTAARRHMKFVPGGIQVQFTRESSTLVDTFDEWLARVVCYAFSLPPLPFVKQVNRATAETAQEAALEEGLEPMMKWVKDLIDSLIVKHWGYTDIEFAWDDDEVPEPEELVGINTQYVNSGIKGIDEARMDLGLEPYGIEPFIPGIGPAGFMPISYFKDKAYIDSLMRPPAPMGDPALGGMAPGDPAAGGEGPLAGVPPDILAEIGMLPKGRAVGASAGADGAGPLAGVPPEILERIGMLPGNEPIEERVTKMADTVARMVELRLAARFERLGELEKREPEPRDPVVVNVAAAQIPDPPPPIKVNKRMEVIRDESGRISGARVIEEIAE